MGSNTSRLTAGGFGHSKLVVMKITIEEINPQVDKVLVNNLKEFPSGEILIKVDRETKPKIMAAIMEFIKDENTSFSPQR